MPVEYQKQIKLTVRRPGDGLYFRLSIMYSVVEQLPELLFTCYRLQESNQEEQKKTDEAGQAASKTVNQVESTDNIFEAADDKAGREERKEIDILEAEDVILAADY